MASDGTILNSMSGGDTIDTENIGGRGKLQRIKIVTGALDSDGGDVSPASPLPVSETTTAIANGTKNVTTSGTPVQLLSSSTAWTTVVVCAKPTNTGVIAVGASNVVAASANLNAIPLMPGDSISLPINDVSKVYIDATVSGEGVAFLYLT
jgi:hypothetical protein